MNREVIIKFNRDCTFDIFAKYKHEFCGYEIPASIINKFDGKEYFCKRITGDAFSLCENIRCIASKNEPNLGYLKRKFNNQVLVIPPSVETIENGVAKLDHDKTYFTGAFRLCGVEECHLRRSNINYIGENAFGNCDLLKLCILPNSEYLKIKEFAFYKCSKFKKLEYEPIPTKTRTGIIFTADNPFLFSRCFSRCCNLKNVTLPASVVLFGEKHFNKTPFKRLDCSTIDCSTVDCSTVDCSTVDCSTVPKTFE